MMKNFKFKIALILVVSFNILSCAQNKKSDDEKSMETIELISLVEIEKAAVTIQLIDVRTPEEYANGYIKNAKNINFNDDDFIEQMSKLDKNKPVYVYCKLGGRSSKAAIQLKEAGFVKIYNFKGGMKQWSAEGKEISKIDIDQPN